MNRRNVKKLSALSIIALATILTGANRSGTDSCAPTPPAPCYPDNCKHCYCLGPTNYQVNAPVGPKTCNGDFNVTVAGLYWNAHQDGMEYAINNEIVGSDSVSGNAELNNLIDAKYLTPNFKWDFGFKVGVGYTTTCDGWDFGVLWTYFREGANGHDEAEFCDNQTLLPLWSAFQFPNAGNAPILFSTDIETLWKLDLNLIDLELGRNYWTSKYLAFRPHVGLRIAYIEQSFDIQYRGGSFNDPGLNLNFNDQVSLDNDYKGVGVRTGFDTTWNVGCGFGLYGNFAFSIIYGKFHIDHDEWLREATSPFAKTQLLQTEESFRASRGILDLGLGVQWASMFRDCAYGFAAKIGWEHHLFFHQNQLWRVMRYGGTNNVGPLNNSGENDFSQRRGNLDTQGWTLRLDFQF